VVVTKQIWQIHYFVAVVETLIGSLTDYYGQ